MALKTLTYTDAADFIKIGSTNLDDGNDWIVYANGGNDTLNFYVDGAVWMDMGAGDDIVTANGSGSGSVFGGLGNDTLTHNANSFFDGVFKLYGGADNDNVTGLAGAADLLYGGAGNDTLVGFAGNAAYGGAGDDFYDLKTGAVFSEAAGGGFDTIRADFATFNFAGKNIEQFISNAKIGVTINGDDFANVVSGSYGGDVLNMGGGNDRAAGGKGNDWIYGDAGNDTVWGGDGDDHIYGGDGNDLLRGDGETYDPAAGADSLYGGAGDDTLEAGHNTSGFGEFLYGGAGNDTYQYLGIDSMGVIVEGVNGGIDTLVTYVSNLGTPDNVENMKLLATYSYDAVTQTYSIGRSDGSGNALANVMTGHDGANAIYGGDGEDTLDGRAGDDTLAGGNQNDFLYGGAGADSLDGGNGDDHAYGGEGLDMLIGQAGNDELAGGAGNDSMYGGTGNDIEYGEDGHDRLDGGAGYDTLFGGAGNDIVIGGDSSDYLYGGDGDDVLCGGASGDILNGGGGADRFVFYTTADSFIGSGIDKIQDFNAAQGDKIDLHGIDADTTAPFNDAFVWRGMSMPQVAKAGNLWGEHFSATVYNPETVRVYGDINGDGVADFSIDVQNVTTLDASAFSL